MVEQEEIMDEESPSFDTGSVMKLMVKEAYAMLCSEMDKALDKDKRTSEHFCIDIENNACGGTAEPCITLYRLTDEYTNLRRTFGKAFGESTSDYDNPDTIAIRIRMSDLLYAVDTIYYDNEYPTYKINMGHPLMTYMAFDLYHKFEEETERSVDCLALTEHSTYGGIIDIAWCTKR